MDSKSIYKKDYHRKYPQDLIMRKDLIREIENNLDYTGKVGLDAGCNGGFLTFYLAENGAKEVYGCDISPSFIRSNNKKLKKLKLNNVHFKEADVTKLPYKDNKFDFVICSEVVEHVEKPGLVISEIYRVLKKDGVAVVSTPNLLNPAEILHNIKHLLEKVLLNREMTHVSHFTPYNINKLFTSFKRTKIKIIGFGAAFLKEDKYGFLKPLDNILATVFPFFAFDIFVYAKK